MRAFKPSYDSVSVGQQFYHRHLLVGTKKKFAATDILSAFQILKILIDNLSFPLSPFVYTDKLIETWTEKGYRGTTTLYDRMTTVSTVS